jgi:DNA-binding HxlR family transcriptional regulator
VDDFKTVDDDQCRLFTEAIELVGKRWSGGILLAVGRGSERFSEITAMVPGLSDRLLSQRLKELEREKLIEREVVASTPVQVRYRLSSRGLDLMRSMQPLVAYGQRWLAPQNAVAPQVLAPPIR